MYSNKLELKNVLLAPKSGVFSGHNLYIGY